jgi:hypothetical protein
LVLAQLDSLVAEDCYSPKIYRIPDPQTEVVPAGGYVEFGLQVTPGSLLYGFLVPCNPTTGVPAAFTFQLEDLSTGHAFFDEPIPSVLLANYHAEVLDPYQAQMSSFWNLLNAVYPVVGSGLFRAQIQSTAAAGSSPVRIEIGIGALRPKRRGPSRKPSRSRCPLEVSECRK